MRARVWHNRVRRVSFIRGANKMIMPPTTVIPGTTNVIIPNVGSSAVDVVATKGVESSAQLRPEVRPRPFCYASKIPKLCARDGGVSIIVGIPPHRTVGNQ